MEEKQSLHSLFMELNSLKNKLAEIEEQKRANKKKQFISNIEGKIEKFANLLTTINKNQESINNKETSITLKMPEKTISNKNSLQLAHTHHDDFMNITLNKTKIEKLIHEFGNCEEKNKSLKSVINELENVNSLWRTQFIEQLCEYRSAKGLLDNIGHLKEMDNDKTISLLDKTGSPGSDLGCFPNDSMNENMAELEKFSLASTPFL